MKIFSGNGTKSPLFIDGGSVTANGSLGNTGLDFYGGFPAADFGVGAGVGGNDANGRTFIYNAISRRLRQDGKISQVTVKISSYAGGDYVKIKVFRPNGATYDYVGESEQIAITATGSQTHTLSTPISCIPGDTIGIFLSSVTIGLAVTTTTDGANSVRYTGGDITSTNVFVSTLTNFSLDLEGKGLAPFLAVTGDSIAEGHNGGTDWDSFYTGGPSGDPEAQIQYWLKTLIDADGVEFSNFQNHADGSKTFAWVASTGIVSSVATTAKAILVHCGVNDVNDGRGWGDVETDLDTIVAALGVGQHLFIDEILPWTNGTDANAVTIRTWNASLVTWCAANDVTLILCHDAMGQNRVATGELDDLLAAYDEDGVHLTNPAGVTKMAEIWQTALYDYYNV